MFLEITIITINIKLFCLLCYHVFFVIVIYFFIPGVTHSFFPSLTLSDTLCFHLGISTNGASALCAGVGTELIKALSAHMLFVLLHILLPMQVVATVVAVEAISHGGGKITPGTYKNKQACQTVAISSLNKAGGFSFKHQMGTVLPFLSHPLNNTG